MKLDWLNTSGSFNPIPSFGIQQIPGVKSKKSKEDNRLDRGYGLDQWGDISIKIGSVANILARRHKNYNCKYYSAFKSQALNDLTIAIRIVQKDYSVGKAIKSLLHYKLDRPVIKNELNDLFKSALKLANR